MRYDCLVASPDGTRLWLVPEATGRSFPFAECDPGWLPNAVGPLQDQFRARYGMDVVVLREILRIDETSVCELDVLGAAPAGAVAGDWHRLPEAAEALHDPAHRAALVRWASDAGVETHFAAWQRRGWFEQASAWIAAMVRQAGLEVSGRITQLKAGWNGSAVLKVPTSCRALYFKASPPRLPGEPAVLRALPRLWARHLPELVAADEAQCWMLVREADGEVLDPEDVEASREAARLYASLQIDQAGDADRWTSLGCPDRGLETMQREIPMLLVDIPGRVAAAGVISEAERDELASFVPQAVALCRELAAFAIPPLSIHHEDFRSGNVLRRRDGTLVILDWNETVVAHPFFSLQRYLWFIHPPTGARRHEILDTTADALRRAVRDAYLEPFGRFEPRRRLLEAFHLSSLLAPIYDALRFRSGQDLDQVFARGLVPEERRIARGLMDHLLEARRASPRLPRARTGWAWPWRTRTAVAAGTPSGMAPGAVEPKPKS
jgi:hypothetical protein